jgi:ATP-dependent Clp protease ATP-binding subunit ClpA
VLLLDEIEKAHPDIYNLLLQVMDHATLTDNTGKKSDFRNVILIMTTNAGAREAERAPVGFGDRSANLKIDKALSRTFSPEFRNRLDALIRFGALPEPVVRRIVDKFIIELNLQILERGVQIEATEDARNWLGKRGYKPEFGAREMGRVIHTSIKQPLADLMLFGVLQDGGIARLVVQTKDGKEELVIEPTPAEPENEAPKEKEPELVH